MKRPTITYHYRGPVERGARYTWLDGFSETTPTGGVLYPWMTRQECQRDAKTRGARAVFAYPHTVTNPQRSEET